MLTHENDDRDRRRSVRTCAATGSPAEDHVPGTDGDRIASRARRQAPPSPTAAAAAHYLRGKWSPGRVPRLGMAAHPRRDLPGARYLIAVDTNILVYSHRPESPFHPAAKKLIEELRRSAALWAIPWPCLHEFVAVATHPKI